MSVYAADSLGRLQEMGDPEVAAREREMPKEKEKEPLLSVRLLEPLRFEMEWARGEPRECSAARRDDRVPGSASFR